MPSAIIVMIFFCNANITKESEEIVRKLCRTYEDVGLFPQRLRTNFEQDCINIPPYMQIDFIQSCSISIMQHIQQVVEYLFALHA